MASENILEDTALGSKYERVVPFVFHQAGARNELSIRQNGELFFTCNFLVSQEYEK